MANTPFPLGAYFGNPNGSDATANAQWESTYNQFVSLMGARPVRYDNYIDSTSTNPSDWIASAQWSASSFAQTGNNYVGPGSGTTPVIGVPMYSASANPAQNDSFFQATAAGQYDNVWKGIVDAWAGQGYKQVEFRPGYQFNGTFMPWGIGNSAGNAPGGPNAPGDWLAAFKRISDDIHQESAADGITGLVHWDPQGSSWSLPNGQNTAAFYPGNQYVDVIDIDYYNDLAAYDLTDWANGGTTQAPNFATWAANPANRMHYWSYPDANQYNPTGTGNGWSLLDAIALAKQTGRPLALSETGAGPNQGGPSDDPAFPQWEAGVLAQAQSQGVQIDKVNLWDAYQYTFTDGSKPNEAAAWAQYFGAQAQPVAADSAAPASSSTSSSSSTPPAASMPVGSEAPFVPSPGSSTPATPTSSSPSTQAPSNIGSNNNALAAPPANPGTTSSDTLQLGLSEDAWQGDAQFTVSIDGRQLDGVQSVDLSHAAGQIETFGYTGNWGLGPHDVRVTFLNDAYGGSPDADRNLYINSVTYDGKTDPANSAALFSNGSVDFTVGLPSNANTDTPVVPAPPPTQPPAPITGDNAELVVGIDQSTWQNSPSFMVAVDGQALSRTTVGNSNNLQLTKYLGSFTAGQHTVSIDFANGENFNFPLNMSADSNMPNVASVLFASDSTYLFYQTVANQPVVVTGT